MNKLLLIDGNSILNRAFYGMAANMLVTKDGTFTNAIYGFLNILEKYLVEDEPSHIAVAFDLKGKTFRHDMYDKYKAGRKGMPPELSMQLPILKEILTAMNIPILEKEGYEADDILGTLSLAASDQMAVTVLTGDKDMLQLVSDKCTVKIPTTSSGQKTVNVFDLQTFIQEYGINPDMFVDVKAIMGDKSDNIPGIEGIGQVGALSLIKEFKSLENIYSNIDSITKPALKDKLEKNKEIAFLSKELSRINKNVPLDDISLDSIKRKSFNNDKLLELFRNLEFNSFIQKFNLDETYNSNEVEEISFIKKDYTDKNQFINKKIFIAYSLDDNLSSIEIITDELEMFVSFGLEADGMLKDALSSADIVVSHYLKELFVYCLNNNIEIPKKYYDTATALYLLDSMKDKYEVDDTYRNLNSKGSADDPVSYKIKYIYEYSEKQLQQTDMVSLFYDVELPLIEVLAFMETTGIKADRQYLLELSEYFDNELNKTASDIFNLAGMTFNINSPEQLGNVLFEELKLPKSKTNASGGYSTSVDVLEKLKMYPIVDKILYYRTVSKLYSTYAQGLLSAISSDGRIHSKFKQTVTPTGRISSTDPNLQNIPIRTEIGRKIRKAFIPEEGFTIVSGDYSQIELRILAHIAQDKNMIKAFLDNEDIHTSTAAKVFSIP
ncbi:MAG TPA: DNA polymerase I, partial [Clostridia bacterium]|nr:DNA polymerase I [Clostridia bacterium]